MGLITDAIAAAFRDYVTDGVASSGLYEVDKSAVRALGPMIESAIANASFGAIVDVVAATKAALDADLAHAAGSVGLVYADATDANNDLYVKTGASGAGGWTLTGAFHGAVGSLAQAYVDQAEAWATGTEPDGIGTKSAREWAEDAEASAESLTLESLFGQTGDLTTLPEIDGNEYFVIRRGASVYKVSLFDLAVYVGGNPEAPPPEQVLITGTRYGEMGDSRMDNGVTPQSLTGNGMSTGVPMAQRNQSIPMWAMHALGWPMELVGQWTLGGSKTSEVFHTAALDVMAARNLDMVVTLVGTNDPVDYTGTGGLAPIPLGDPDADPSTLPRVGDTYPVAPGTADQGTTLGNYDKAIRYCEALGIVVIAFEIPTENAGRIQRNADVHKWLRAQQAAGTYSNLIAPNIYDAILATPGADDGDVAGGVWRTDVTSTVGVLMSDTTTPLHPAPPGARLLGEALAAAPEIVAAFAGRPSILHLPDGTNDADFINPNPYLLVGAGNGTLGYAGSNTPYPTGTCAEGWQCGHSVSNGTIGMVMSMTPGGHGQRITITRSGGTSHTTARMARLRCANINITPVAGDIYVCEAVVVVPARPVQDVFAVTPYIAFTEAGMVDELGQSISAGNYGAFRTNNPQFFPKDGDSLTIRGVQFEVTPAMVASATGSLAMAVLVDIWFADDLDTATNGALVVDILSCGFRKVA